MHARPIAESLTQAGLGRRFPRSGEAVRAEIYADIVGTG